MNKLLTRKIKQLGLREDEVDCIHFFCGKDCPFKKLSRWCISCRSYVCCEYAIQIPYVITRCPICKMEYYADLYNRFPHAYHDGTYLEKIIKKLN